MTIPEQRTDEALVDQCRSWWDGHVEAVDAGIGRRLARARAAALAGAGAPAERPFRVPGVWLPAAVCGVAGALALAVWLSRPVAVPNPTAELAPVEDAELLASVDEPDLYAEEAAFYAWAGSDGGAG